jgi:hypothetical protein
MGGDMTEINIGALADKTVEDIRAGRLVVDGLRDVKEAIKEADGFMGKIKAGAKAIGKLVYGAVKYAEQLGRDLKLAGNQKRELAVQVINKLIDLPWLNESMEATMIGFAIDVLIAGFNAHIGKKWLDFKADITA